MEGYTKEGVKIRLAISVVLGIITAVFMNYMGGYKDFYNDAGRLDFQNFLPYLILGIIVCALVIFVIRNIADCVWKTGKIIYKRYTIPLVLATILLYLSFKGNIVIGELTISSIAIKIISIATIFMVLAILISKHGISRGICMMLVQIAGAVMCASFAYASIILVLFAIIGETVVFDAITYDYQSIMSIDDGEIVYVKKDRRKEKYFIDQYGRTYMNDGRYVYRIDDEKFFTFY